MAKKKAPKSGTGTWIVKARCVVVKQITCEDCTEDEARTDPWEHAVDEVELDQEESTVIEVEAND